MAEQLRCWVCGEAIVDEATDFEPDGYHGACATQAQRIDEGLRASRATGWWW